MKQSLISTNYFFKHQKSFYRGKVRDVYNINDDYLVVIACDRISAFDHVLPRPIPYKGQVLNQIAAYFLDATAKNVPNWKIATPDPNVTVGYRCEPYHVEFVIRGYLAGHAWREYKQGKREVCGVKLPDGLRENDKLPEPIITPTTKEQSKHDEDISLKDIVKRKLISQADLDQIVAYTHQLYNIGTKMADKQGLILVDTKYEFGNRNGQIMLIDEVHTPDSSRYFYKKEYTQRQEKGEAQKQLSKEFVRQWLIEHNFQGEPGQSIPEMTDEFIGSVIDRYVELFEKITGEQFIKRDYKEVMSQIENHINHYLVSHNII